MKHSDYVTHIDNKEDVQFLRKVLFPVNIRLLQTSDEYKHIIQECCDYLSKMVLTKCDGYKLPHGMSGANLAIPFNIIAIAENRNCDEATSRVMINPKILAYQGKPVQTTSNCGSLTLEEPIKVWRWPQIIVEYYEIWGEKVQYHANQTYGSFTIQHEVDHNNGLLITDRTCQ